MAITVKITKRTPGGRPALYATRDFDVLPVTIGRDAACSICLEDPQKHMSRFHAEIQEEGGTYWMAVVSKVNPVMAQGRRYGPGTRLTLHSGDSFEFAEYEVQVMLPEPVPAVEKPAAKPPPCADTPPELTFIPQKRAAPTPAPPGGMSDALLRAAVEGIMMLLRTRSEMRKAFGGDERAMAGAGDNNPLKRMFDPREAMDFLLDPGERTDGLLDPVQAVSDACEDLRVHELALIAGMRAAVQGALGRLDPNAIERAFENSEKGFSLGSRKAKLWELFVMQQDKLSRGAQDDFNQLFGRDFMSAYQAHLRAVKDGR
jgi:predicted component of type VI protein secretion system